MEAENVRLCNEHSEDSARIDAEVELSHTLTARKSCLAAEAEQLQQLCKQAIADLHDERTWAREGITSLEECVLDLTQGQEAAQPGSVALHRGPRSQILLRLRPKHGRNASP